LYFNKNIDNVENLKKKKKRKFKKKMFRYIVALKAAQTKTLTKPSKICIKEYKVVDIHVNENPMFLEFFLKMYFLKGNLYQTTQSFQPFRF